ncbi:MAG: hypothetical protein AAB316_11425, partial [Bacteroidota bacterium]
LDVPGTFVILEVSAGEAPPPPGGFAFGGLVLDVLFYDGQGNLVEGQAFNAPVRLCLPASDEQIASYTTTTPHNPDLFTFAPAAGQWERLPDTFVLSDGTPQQICGNVSHLTLFALLVQTESGETVALTATAESATGATGGAGSRLSIWLAVGAIALILAGIAVYLLAGRRRRGSEPTPPAPPADKMPGPR